MKKSVYVSVIVLLLLVIVMGGWYAFKRDSFPFAKNSSSDYSAVFLVNGQVYFGKLGSSSGGYTSMTDIYYLQTNQKVQPSDKKAADTTQDQLSLVKLGNELHGPKDKMRINNSQIVFTEDLKSDGQVVKAITAFVKGEQPAPAKP